MKKYWIGILILALTLTIALSISACGEKDATPVSIAVDTGSFKNAYVVGETPDWDNARLIVTFSDGEETTVPLTQSMLLNSFNSDSEGKRNLQISYEGLRCIFQYNVSAPTVVSRVRSTALEGVYTTYAINESMRYDGTLSATFDDGTTQSWALADIRRTLTVSGFRTDKAGSYQCQLAYETAYGTVTVGYDCTVKPLTEMVSAIYTSTEPVRVFVDDTANEFVQQLMQYPFAVTYADGTTDEVYVDRPSAVDRALDTDEVSENKMVYVTVTDSFGRSARTSVQYMVVHRYDVYTVVFDPNFDDTPTVSVKSDVATGRVAEQNFDRKGWRCLGWYNSANGERFNFSGVVTSDMTLVADWKKLDYAINIISFGVKYGNTRYYTVTQTVVLDAPAPVDGYTFLYYTYQGVKLENNTIYPNTWAEDLELQAKWEAIEYSLTYDLHATDRYPVGNADLFVNGTYTTQDTRILSTPVRAGYTFVGWSTDAAGTRMIQSLGGQTGDITLHACWAADTYYVNFVQASTGTRIASKAPLAYSVNSSDEEISPATITGYRFEGWYLDADCTEPFYSTTVGGNKVYVLQRGRYTADFTLYAKTTPVYTIYLTSEFASGSSALTFAEGEDADDIYLQQWQAAAASGKNCDLEEWVCDAGESWEELHVAPVWQDGQLSAVSVTCGALAEYGGRTFRAVWKGRIRNIVYNYNYDERVENATYDTYLGATLPQPTRGGYFFDGWYRDAGFHGERFAEIRSCDYNVNFVFYAKWIIIPYTLTFHYNIDEQYLTTKLQGVESTGTFTLDTLQYTVERDTVAFLPQPKAKYNVFNGWYTNPDGTGIRMSELPKGTYGVEHLYAKWTPILYKISFYNIGGSEFEGSMQAGQMTAVDYSTHSILLYPAERVGYTFGGWYHDVACESPIDVNEQGIAYLDVDTLITLYADQLDTGSSELQSIYSVYAKWTADPYTITFGNGKAGSTNVTAWTNPNMPAGSATGKLNFAADNIITLQNASANGYVFLGWYTAVTGGEQVTTTNHVYQNLSLYPRWEKGTYTIEYVFNADFDEETVASWGLPSSYGLGDNSVSSSNFKTNISNKITRFGYTMTGMYDSEGNAVTALGASTAGAIPCADITLYCHWEIIQYKVTLKYKTSGGSYANYATDLWDGAYEKTGITVENVGDTRIPAMTMTGYVTQRDWYTDSNCTKLLVQVPAEDAYVAMTTDLLATASNAALTLYCKFEASQYTLHYSCETLETYNASLPEADRIALPADLTFTYFAAKKVTEVTLTDGTGYRWYGWYTDDTYTTRVQNVNGTGSATDNLRVSADVTLYGRVEVLHTIHYEPEGASIASGPVTVFTKAQTTTLKAASYTGKVFSGWYLDGVGNIGLTLPAGLDGDVTLTPIFHNGSGTGLLLEYNQGGTAGIVVGCTGSGAYTIPTLMGTVNMFLGTDGAAALPVTDIAQRAFYGSACTTVIIPDGILHIGDEAFANCKNMTKLTVNGGEIGQNSYLLDGCSKLAEVILNGCTIRADANMFCSCPLLKKVTISGGNVAAHVLQDCTYLESLTVNGNQTLATMFRVTGNIVYPPTGLTTLRITGTAPDAHFGDGIGQLTQIATVYLDSAEILDLGALSEESRATITEYLSTRTKVVVPNATLKTAYETTYGWTNVATK